ncbi:MAG: hypothetical protein GX601_07390 [Anaerolineales bacterium]|nr:hypothetical protein [Anaerolineales bacterium]
MIEFISIIVLTFALMLIVLGLITAWLERSRGRLQGFALVLVGLLVGAGYSFLGSRFSIALFGRLIVRVNLPALMARAMGYTAGVIVGAALAVGIFLWATGRFRQRVERTVVAVVIVGVLIALGATFLAIVLSVR